MPVIKGNLKLEIDEMGLEARVSIAPDPGGADITPDLVRALLREKGVTQGIEAGEIDRMFRMLERKGEAMSFAAARGIPAVDAQPEGFVLEPFTLPEELSAAVKTVLSHAPAPVVSGPDGKLHAVDPEVMEVGYVKKDAVVGRVRPASQGRDGKSIYGRPIRAERFTRGGLLLGRNLRVDGHEVRAETSGIIRRGESWCDLVPYQRAEFTLHADAGTCLLSFTPGRDGGAVDAQEVIAEAERLGFSRASLLPAGQIDAALRKAAASGSPLSKVSITPAADASVSVTVSPDKLRATLTIHKHRGAGRKLALSEVGGAIKRSGVKGFDAEIVRKDILGFYSGSQTSMENYTLVLGSPAENGQDGKIEWLAPMFSGDEAAFMRKLSEQNPPRPEDLPSLGELPLHNVEAMGRVSEGQEVLRIIEAGAGNPGVDVFKAVIPAQRGAEARCKLLENLKRRKDAVVSAIDGIVERGERDGVLLVRVRPYKDAVVVVALSPDRMRGYLSYHPPQGSGRNVGPEDLTLLIEKEGIVRGVKSEAVLEALDKIRKREPVTGLIVAEGQRARGAEQRKVVFHVSLASGSRVQVRDDGKADFKNQDTITQVSKGAHLASLPPPGSRDEEGWDVTGAALAPEGIEDTLPQPGKNVRVQEREDGGSELYAQADGEFTFVDNVLDVKQTHTVTGDVDLTTGNIKFKGRVHVNGSVLSGFSLVCGDDAVIDEVIQGAFISSDGSVIVGQGIKGEGKAVIRARGDIKASFVEQAALLSMGNIRLRSACIHSHVKCNGKLVLDGEKGNLIGGKALVKLGASIQNLGSPGGARTELSFGQDYVVKDLLDKEQKYVDTLKLRIRELEAQMKKLERSMNRSGLEKARAEKRDALKDLEARGLRLLNLRDRFEEHFPSEVSVRGTLYPGTIVESHGRIYTVKEERTRIVLQFDPNMGRILEKPGR